MAQNAWETPENEQGEKVNPDAKYLADAVPVVDGKVTFETTIAAPGKSAGEIYDAILPFLTKMTKEEGQFEQSDVKIADRTKGEIAAQYQEWLIFKSTSLVFDRTFFAYTIMVDCADGSATIRMSRIYYLYPEDEPQKFIAEETITDEYGLKKGGDKLSRVFGRFRKKTIDRKDYIFNKIEALLK